MTPDPISGSWGWKVTLHIYGTGARPAMTKITAASKAVAEILGADDFVGADVKVVRDPPHEQVAS